MDLSHSDIDGRRTALNLAREIRKTREESIANIRSGSVGLFDVLESDDPLVRQIKVVTVVENLPNLGKVKARRILEELGVPAHLKIHELDQRQRRMLLERTSNPSEP